MSYFLITILTCVLELAKAQELFAGGCPPVKPMTSFLIQNFRDRTQKHTGDRKDGFYFELRRQDGRTAGLVAYLRNNLSKPPPTRVNYSGSWYEIEKYWFIPEAQSSCVNVVYADNGDETFKVNIAQQVNGKFWENPGITRYLSTDGSASFLLDLIVSQSPLPFVISYPYIVIDTDYHNYTIKYACKQIGFYNMQTLWILSKEKSISPAVRQVIYEKLTHIGLDITRLRASNLSTCSAKETSS